MKFVTLVSNPKRRQATRWERGSARVFAVLGALAVAVIVVALLRGSGVATGGGGAGGAAGGKGTEGGNRSSQGSGDATARPKPRLVTQSGGGGGGGQRSPDALVADKVVQFSQGRRQLVETLAQKFNVILPPDVDRFFSAVEAGEWRDIKAVFNGLSSLAGSADAPEGFGAVWPAIRETYAVAEARMVWPPDQLLAFGQTVMASMKPGMAYVGGTQWGNAVPNLLNESSGADQSLVLDHAMLSNSGYLDYLGAAYGDRMTVVSKEEAEKAREAYFAELSERAKNNQLRPGENVPSGSSRELVPGSIGATDVSERLLLAMLEKNPGMSVAIEKPQPGSPLYEHAVPMGPIFEVRAPSQGGAVPFTAAEAQQTVSYWKDAVDQMQAMGQTDDTQVTRRSLAEMAMNQAQFLANRSLGAEAEQTYRSALDLAPSAVEPAGALARYLNDTGRTAEAQQVLDEFLKQNPQSASDVEYQRSRLVEPKR